MTRVAVAVALAGAMTCGPCAPAGAPCRSGAVDLGAVTPMVVPPAPDEPSVAFRCAPVVEPIAPGLVVLFALPDGTLFMDEDRADCACDPMERSRANLERHGEARGERLGQGDTFVLSVDGDAADLLVVPELWEAIDAELPGDLVVVPAAQDVVFYGATDDADALEAMITVAEAAYVREERPVSPAPLVWTPGGWTTYAP